MGKVLGRAGSRKSWSDVVKGRCNSREIRGKVKVVQADKQDGGCKNHNVSA